MKIKIKFGSLKKFWVSVICLNHGGYFLILILIFYYYYHDSL